jgi:hypothetical protein
MQGVYFRPSKRKPWVLLRATRSVADAEGLARRTAKREKRGRLLYVEARELPTDVWDMRNLDHRRLGGWLCKSLVREFHIVKRGGRKAWQKKDKRQLYLFAFSRAEASPPPLRVSSSLSPRAPSKESA